MNETILEGVALWERLAEILGESWSLAQVIFKESGKPDRLLIGVSNGVYATDDQTLLMKCLLPEMEARGFPSWRISRSSNHKRRNPYVAAFQQAITPGTTDETHICATGRGETPLIAAIRAADRALQLLDVRIASETKAEGLS